MTDVIVPNESNAQSSAIVCEQRLARGEEYAARGVA